MRKDENLKGRNTRIEAAFITSLPSRIYDIRYAIYGVVGRNSKSRTVGSSKAQAK